MKDSLVSILGAGQLGRMLALAGYPLGLQFRFLDPTPGSPAGQFAHQLVAPYDDLVALEQLASGAACITYEFENVDVAVASSLERHLPVFPPPLALETAQDRLTEKRFFQTLGAATPPFLPVDSHDQLLEALETIGTPAVLKTRRMGYDGKGQAVIRATDEADAAWTALGGQPLILEGFVAFRRELSIIAVRSRAGETAFYPLVENHHREGILRRSNAPAPELTPWLQAEAEQIASRALAALEYVGVLAIELFEVDGSQADKEASRQGDKQTKTQPLAFNIYNGQPTTDNGQRTLVVNEMAPRVHNSGHWTIEGAETSQFENHLRAILGLPLGSTRARGQSVMLNIIGDLPDTTKLLAIPGLHLHLYGKAPRPGRKLGHLTLSADNDRTFADRVAQAESLL